MQGRILFRNKNYYGKLPTSWLLCHLTDIGFVTGGGTPDTCVQMFYEKGTIDWITPAIMAAFSGAFAYESPKKITNIGLNNSSAKLIDADSLTISSRAPIGYVTILKKPMCTSQGARV